jgi:hypothetical protein
MREPIGITQTRSIGTPAILHPLVYPQGIEAPTTPAPWTAYVGVRVPGLCLPCLADSAAAVGFGHGVSTDPLL